MDVCKLLEELIEKVFSYLGTKHLQEIINETNIPWLKNIAVYICYRRIKIHDRTDVAQDPETIQKLRPRRPSVNYCQQCADSKLEMTLDQFIEFRRAFPECPVGNLELSIDNLVKIHERFSTFLKKVASIHVHVLNPSMIRQLNQLPYHIVFIDLPLVGSDHMVDEFEYPKTVRHLKISLGRFNDITTFIRRFPYLESLIINGCPVPIDCIMSEARWLSKLGISSTSLKKVKSSKILLPNVMRNLSISFGNTFPEMDEPTFDASNNIDLSSCLSLRELTFFRDSDIDLNRISLPPYLRKLHLSEVKYIHHGELLQSLRALTELEILGFFDAFAYFELFKKCEWPKGLKKLHIHNFAFQAEIEGTLEVARNELNHCFNRKGDFQIEQNDFQLPILLEELSIVGFPYLSFSKRWKVPPNLRSLQLSYMDGFDPISNQYSPRRLTNLEFKLVNLGELNDIQFPECMSTIWFENCNINKISNSNLFALSNLVTFKLVSDRSISLQINRDKFDECDMSGMKTLRELDLSGVKFEQVCRISFPKSLETLKLNHCGICSFKNPLQSLTHLRYLGLANNFIGMHLFENLPGQLRFLNLSGISISTNGSIVFDHHNLESLFLKGANFHDCDLSKCKKLKVLNLENSTTNKLDSHKLSLSLEELNINGMASQEMFLDFSIFGNLKKIDMKKVIVNGELIHNPGLDKFEFPLVHSSSSNDEKDRYIYTEEEVQDISS